jgi:hypothetical protein
MFLENVLVVYSEELRVLGEDKGLSPTAVRT